MVELSSYEAFALALGALLFGIWLLIRGGNWTIDSAVYLATHHGISPMVVGFTIVAFGTSFPELIVSLLANLQGSPGIALGGVIGSNIANILMVIGLSAIFVTLKIKPSTDLKRDLAVMIFASIWLVWILSAIGGNSDKSIGHITGFFMLGFLVLFVFWQYFSAKSQGNIEIKEDIDVSKYENNSTAIIFLLLGFIAIAAGAEFLVKGAMVSAALLHIPESVIALSIIAFGTSLPELSTSIIAGRKGQDDIVIGNIIGSNVFNILMILGFTLLVKPIQGGSFDPQIVSFDIWLMLGIVILFSAILLTTGKISRITGFLFCFIYFIYNVFIYTTAGVSF